MAVPIGRGSGRTELLSHSVTGPLSHVLYSVQYPECCIRVNEQGIGEYERLAIFGGGSCFYLFQDVTGTFLVVLQDLLLLTMSYQDHICSTHVSPNKSKQII